MYEWDACPSGVLDSPPSSLLDFSATPNMPAESLTRMAPYFKPVNAGNVTIELTACELLTFEPLNTGNFVIDGGDATYVIILNPTNAPPAGKSLRMLGGKVSVIGGVNYGPGPILFENGDGATLLAFLENQGTCEFLGGSDIQVISVVNAATGTILFQDATAALYNVSNEGEVLFEGGSYELSTITNDGPITFSSVTTVSLVDVANTGEVSIDGGSFTWLGGSNLGPVSVSNASQARAR